MKQRQARQKKARQQKALDVIQHLHYSLSLKLSCIVMEASPRVGRAVSSPNDLLRLLMPHKDCRSFDPSHSIAAFPVVLYSRDKNLEVVPREPFFLLLAPESEVQGSILDPSASAVLTNHPR
jgi:hypothetical protein